MPFSDKSESQNIYPFADFSPEQTKHEISTATLPFLSVQIICFSLFSLIHFGNKKDPLKKDREDWQYPDNLSTGWKH